MLKVSCFKILFLAFTDNFIFALTTFDEKYKIYPRYKLFQFNWFESLIRLYSSFTLNYIHTKHIHTKLCKVVYYWETEQ